MGISPPKKTFNTAPVLSLTKACGLSLRLFMPLDLCLLLLLALTLFISFSHTFFFAFHPSGASSLSQLWLYILLPSSLVIPLVSCWLVFLAPLPAPILSVRYVTHAHTPLLFFPHPSYSSFISFPLFLFFPIPLTKVDNNLWIQVELHFLNCTLVLEPIKLDSEKWEKS